jgi:hypothetical protein
MEENLDRTPGGLHQNSQNNDSVGDTINPARQPGLDNGFDFQTHQHSAQNDQVFEGGMGDALGEYGDEDNDLMAMEEELNGDENEEGAG